MSITKDKATIAWSAPPTDGGSPVTGYVIEAKRPYDHRWTVVKTDVPAGATSCEVTGLIPDADYEFRVLAVNKAGTSRPSDLSQKIKIGKSNSANISFL
jgi:titin